MSQEFQDIHITTQTLATKNKTEGTEFFYFVYLIIPYYLPTFILSPTFVSFNC